MNSPKVIFFDAAGTLFELTRTVGEHYAEVGNGFGLSLQADSLNHAFRLAWKRAPAPPVTPGSREDDDRGWWRALVQDVFSQTNSPFSEDYFEAVFGHFLKPGVWQLFPETLEVLESVKHRAQLGVISNFDRRLYPILENLGLHSFFDPIIISSEVGADKPHPQIFAKALSAAGLENPDEALHVGDDPEADWHGANRAGLRVFALDRPRRSLRDLFEILD